MRPLRVAAIGGRALVIVASLTRTAIAKGETFALPTTVPQHMRFAGRWQGNQIRAEYTVKRSTEDGREVLRIAWVSPLRTIDAVIDARSGRPLRSVVADRAQRHVSRTEYVGDKARYSFSPLTGSTGEREKWIEAEDLYDSFTLDIVFLGFPFTAPRPVHFRIINANDAKGSVYRMKLSPEGVEDVMVGGRAIPCQKLKLDVAGPLGAFAPNYYFWYTAAAPHEYVKMAGPDEMIERIDLRPGIASRTRPSSE